MGNVLRCKKGITIRSQVRAVGFKAMSLMYFPYEKKDQKRIEYSDGHYEVPSSGHRFSLHL